MPDADTLARLLRRRADSLQARAHDLERAGRREGWSPVSRDPALYRILAEQFRGLADDLERAD